LVVGEPAARSISLVSVTCVPPETGVTAVILFVTVPPRLFWYTQVLPTPIGQSAKLLSPAPVVLCADDGEWLPAADFPAELPDEPDAELAEGPQPARTSPAAISSSAGPTDLHTLCAFRFM
jgi:hypothetical protein